jgi:hypothetical protein
VGMKRPPTYPTELTYPCCLPALGRFGKMSPHGGLAESVAPDLGRTDVGRAIWSPSDVARILADS